MMFSPKDKKRLQQAGKPVEDLDLSGDKAYAIHALEDLDKKHDVTIEANWNKNVEQHTALRFTIGGKSAVIRNADLRDILMLFLPMEDVQKMMIHSKRFYENREAEIKITASRPYYRGETIYAKVQIPYPVIRK